MKISHYIFILAAVCALTSCHSSKSHLSYLSQLPEARQGTISSSDYAIRLTPEDELEIVVTSTVPTATTRHKRAVQRRAKQHNIHIRTTEIHS